MFRTSWVARAVELAGSSGFRSRSCAAGSDVFFSEDRRGGPRSHGEWPARHTKLESAPSRSCGLPWRAGKHEHGATGSPAPRSTANDGAEAIARRVGPQCNVDRARSKDVDQQGACEREDCRGRRERFLQSSPRRAYMYIILYPWCANPLQFLDEVLIFKFSHVFTIHNDSGFRALVPRLSGPLHGGGRRKRGRRVRNVECASPLREAHESRGPQDGRKERGLGSNVLVVLFNLTSSGACARLPDTRYWSMSISKSKSVHAE